MHAFDEFSEVLSNTVWSRSGPNQCVAYCAALVSELAYYHVPQFEIDDEWKRAKRVPCFAHQRIFQLKRQTNVAKRQPSVEDLRIQVYTTNRVVSVVVETANVAFIGFRGTVDAYDWFINLKASKKNHNFHKGFYEEAERICSLILDGREFLKDVILCGHSLGGAVAVVSIGLLRTANIRATYIFGAPRAGNEAALDDIRKGISGNLFHIRRDSDVVPLVPPKVLGFSDYQYEFNPYLGSL